MASPVSNANLRKRLLPSGYLSILESHPWRVVVDTASLISSMWVSIHSMTLLPCSMPSTLSTGARVMASP